MFLFPSVQEINTAERHVCLTRDVQTSLSLSMETTVSKVTSPTWVKKIDVFMTCSPYLLWSYLLINALFKCMDIIMVIKPSDWVPISGENSNSQHQEQSAGSRAPWSPSPSQGNHRGLWEEKKGHRHQRGRFSDVGCATVPCCILDLFLTPMAYLLRTQCQYM